MMTFFVSIEKGFYITRCGDFKTSHKYPKESIDLLAKKLYPLNTRYEHKNNIRVCPKFLNCFI